jgi:hypothetical protein
MAKCPVCNTRKGKRKCAIVNNQFVCSLCCANTRKEEICLDCVFYLPLQHNYDAVPAFSAAVLANNHALQNYSHRLENAYQAPNPQDALAIIELLLNKYHFNEAEIKTSNALWQAGFETADHVIKADLQEIDHETLINLLGAMRNTHKNSIENLQASAA